MSGPPPTDGNAAAGEQFGPSPFGAPALLPHDDAGPKVLAVTWSLWCFAGAFLATRIYCKRGSGRRLWWDDHFLLASQAIHLVSACLMTKLVVSFDYGKHPWDIPNASPIPTSDNILVQMTRATCIITATSWSKTAFAITMLRFFTGRASWLIWFIIISMNLALGVCALVPWVSCIPLHKSWNLTIEGTCLPFSVPLILAYVSGAYSAACDLVLAMLPWAILSNLSMGLKEKLGVGVAMSMGVAACIMAIIKTVSLKNISFDSNENSKLNIYDTAEISVTIMAASIPAMRVLFKDLRSSARGSSGRRYYQTSVPQYGANRSGIVVTVKAEGGERDDSGPGGRDDMSDRRILGSETRSGDGKIYRVDEVEVVSTYSHKRGRLSDEEGAYEMQDTGRKNGRRA
ncbi:hypothetical protein QBC38DRAFT_499480 [Podospora fimiseda]|uniref:Rhodopsin domain-containing protein n=1 Tax=Podospora fimiseda TaxID=252190 RepID=A0AAN7BPZ5_9PEZI|nr:hypothetical protein QBC38DRAFT_499480 [Podospora fimiseda]